jgi:hypothetical protein
MKKLPFPKNLAVTPCTVTLNGEGLDEDGAPVQSLSWSGKAIFSEKSRTTLTADKRLVTLEGKVIIEGDIAPNTVEIADGEVTVAGKKYMVYRCERPRNPDGSVHHTTLELM